MDRASLGGELMVYCHTCQRSMHHRGIAMHRKAHRTRKENCTITLGSGTWTWRYAEGEE